MQKPLAAPNVPDNVQGEKRNQCDSQPHSEALGMFGGHLQLFAERVAHGAEGYYPKRCSGCIAQQEAPQGHAEEPGQRRCCRAQARNELGEQQSPRTEPCKNILGPSHAGIWLERNPAHQVEHRVPSFPSEPVPKAIT